QSIFYSYDADGNITTITDASSISGKTVNFSYDALSRLLSASTTAASSNPFTQSYSYSPLGNITNKSDIGDYAYIGTGNPNPHAPTTVGTTTLSYDKNGNLLTNG